MISHSLSTIKRNKKPNLPWNTHVFSTIALYTLFANREKANTHSSKIEKFKCKYSCKYFRRKRFRRNDSVRISRPKSEGGLKKLIQNKFLGVLNKASAAESVLQTHSDHGCKSRSSGKWLWSLNLGGALRLDSIKPRLRIGIGKEKNGYRELLPFRSISWL